MATGRKGPNEKDKNMVMGYGGSSFDPLSCTVLCKNEVKALRARRVEFVVPREVETPRFWTLGIAKKLNVMLASYRRVATKQ
jgi:hypothetical protein